VLLRRRSETVTGTVANGGWCCDAVRRGLVQQAQAPQAEFKVRVATQGAGRTRCGARGGR